MSCENCIKLGQRIHELQTIIHQKNIELDALGRVWCDGGCGSGMFRFTPFALTEIQVKIVERNTARIRTWWNNYKWKLLRYPDRYDERKLGD